MIEKMKFVSITGVKEDLDRVIEEHVSQFDIQLENALLELKTAKGLLPYVESNPYKESFALAEQINKEAKLKDSERLEAAKKDICIADASALITQMHTDLSKLLQIQENIRNKQEAYEARLSDIEKFIGLDYDIETILQFRHIRFRFGRIQRDYYDKFMAFVYEGIDSIFYKCREEKDYIWAIYFVPESVHEKIDAIYASMHFERFYLPEGYKGTPAGAAAILQEKIQHCREGQANVAEKIHKLLLAQREDFAAAYEKLRKYNANFDIRKLAALTKNSQRPFYILCGWMRSKDADVFYKQIEKDPKAFCIIEENHGNLSSKPPTRLKNAFLFQPYELFVDMLP